MERPPALDWSIGHYETTAAQLLPAARVVVDSARLQAGERVVDVGCGTGNATLLAAEAGADVTGVDPASRLLDVARARAAEEGKQVPFELGEAAALPIGDASADVVLSVFGVIFAPDAGAAAAEMARVLLPTGRIVLSAWLPQGGISAMNAAAGEAVREAMGAPTPPPSFAWHDPDALAGLLSPLGFTVDVEQHDLAFTAPSVEAYLDSEAKNHPMAITGLGVLQRLGRADAVHERLIAILQDANEDPTAFRVTSQYVVVKARR